MKILLSFLFFVAASILATSTIANALTLNKYPSLQCSACKAVIEILGDKMNETASKKTTFLKSHRIEGNQVGDRRADYATSEVRGYELLENLCEQNNYGSYMLREERRTGLRIFSREAALQQCLPYNDVDRKDLHDTMTSKYVHKICAELVEEHEDALVKLVKNLRQLDDLQHAFCGEATRLCLGKRYDKGVKEDLARRAAWRKKTGIRTGTDVENEKEEKAKQEAATAAEEAAKQDTAGAKTEGHPVEAEILQEEQQKPADL